MEETKVTDNNTRTRIKISLTAKGTAQWEISCEYDSPEKSTEQMGKAIDLTRSLIAEKGLKEAGAD